MKLPKLSAPPIELVPRSSLDTDKKLPDKEKSLRQLTEEGYIEHSLYFPNIESSSAEKKLELLEKASPIANSITLFLSWISHIFAAYVLIAFIATSVSNQGYQLSAFTGAVQYVEENISTDFFEEIISIDSSSQCTGDYQPLPVGVYLGTEVGCYFCGSIIAGNCPSTTQTCGGLLYIPARPSVELFVWKGKRLCAKPLADHMIAKICPEEYDSCGKDICVPTGSLCPITTVTYSGNDFQFTQDDKFSPLVRLDIIADGLPCLSKNFFPRHETPYALDADLGNGCGIYGEDTFSFAVDSAPYIDILKENDAWDNVKNLLGYDVALADREGYLAGRRLVDIKPGEQCEGLTFPEIGSIEDVTKTRLKVGKTIWLVSGILLLFLGSVLICYVSSIVYSTGKCTALCFGKIRRRFYVYQILWGVIMGGLLLAGGAIFVSLASNTASLSDRFSFYSTCFGGDIKVMFMNFKGAYDDTIVPYLHLGIQGLCFGVLNTLLMTISCVITHLINRYIRSNYEQVSNE